MLRFANLSNDGTLMAVKNVSFPIVADAESFAQNVSIVQLRLRINYICSSPIKISFCGDMQWKTKRLTVRGKSKGTLKNPPGDFDT